MVIEDKYITQIYDKQEKSGKIHSSVLLHETFISSGLYIPEDLAAVTRSIFNTSKFYGHIAWFEGRGKVPQLSLEYIKGGNFDFVPHVLKSRGLNTQQISWMISDHYPLWAEFSIRD